MNTEPASGVLRPPSSLVMPSLAALERAMGRRPQRAAEAFRSLAEEALAQAAALVQPAAVWAEMEAAGLAESLLPGIPAAHLAGIHTLIGVVCTIGPLLEAEAHRLFAASEYARGYLLDQIGALAVARLAEHVADLLRAGRDAARWAPGDDEGDWAMDAQRLLFALLPTDEIGVRLSEHNVMFPTKSLSFVLLVGNRPADLHCLGRCDRCIWKGSCDRRLRRSMRRRRESKAQEA